jgi:hypothetical protein
VARAVYSTRFVEIPFGAPASASYTVPAGYIAVVRDIDVRFSGGTGGPMVVQVADPNVILAVLNSGDAITGMAQWQGRTVCNEGEVLEALNLGSVDASCAVSGYLLSM